MKRITSLFFLTFLLQLVYLPIVHAQNPMTVSGWAERLKLFGDKLPQEEVFIHMDNSCYYLGDTIYFKAYMRLSDGQPSTLSQLLYVELLNHDGYLVERQNVEMKNGQGWGAFALLDTLYGGYYELRAYTRWQLNWGLYEHPHTKNAEKWFYSQKMAREYYRDYDKLYSRVFPVYDKPRTAGDYSQDMTMRPMRRVFKQKEEEPKAVVKFYPEGGIWVAGTRQRIAFEANDEDGKHLKGELSISFPDGGGLVRVPTANRGRGSFDCPAWDGLQEVTATFKWDNHVQTVSLPKPEENGCAMRATTTDEGIHVEVLAHGIAATEMLGLTASCHGVQKSFQLLGTGPKHEADIAMADLPTGVIQLTVYNAEGRIYADRLIFVRQPGFQPENLSIEGVKAEGYQPYEPITISVQSAVGESSDISVAVRDEVHSDYTFDSGNIMTEMLLSSQIKGFVEQPEYFFEADDEEHRTALDLLLMVQGWRRYDWVQMATPGAFTLLHPYERTQLLTGEVNRYQAQEQEDAMMKMMDEHEQAYEEDMAAIQSRKEALTGEDESQFSEEGSTGESTINEIESGISSRFDNDMTHQGTRSFMNASMADGQFMERYKEGGTLKDEAKLHAEFTQPWAKENNSAVIGEMDTYNKGAFKIEVPKFYEFCYFFCAAVSQKSYKGDKQIWVEVNEDKNGDLNYPEYYLKFNPVYPRFVKPYNFYQQNSPTSRLKAGKRLYVDDDAILMDEVVIGAKRSGMRRFDPSKPAFVLDAYDAFNEVCDAGFSPGVYYGASNFVYGIARTYIGDMNMERSYPLEIRYDKKNTSSNISGGVMEYYDHLPRLDMVYVYTDYSPRREGDRKFSQDNQPLVTIDLRLMPNNGQRMTWRDRRMVLKGYAVCDEFYQPDYSKQTPREPTDYRRTLYWNPNVKLDNEGRAELHFFNNSQKTYITVSAEGMTSTGTPLTGVQYTEGQ